VVKLNKAIFLDRDGTLNKAVNINQKKRPPYNFKELKIYKDIKILNQFAKSYLLIITTNQPDLKSKKQKKSFNNFINKKIKKKILIKKIYTCKCFEYEKNCKCYKPKNGMIKSATKKFKIDLKNSYVIGDSWRDIGAGKRSGCKTIFINRDKNNIKIKRYKPDFKIKNLSTLKKIIEV
tara:strand:- start:456 stop:989 length:534 start_codon:yes stop_codon:yes gene_type:complete